MSRASIFVPAADHDIKSQERRSSWHYTTVLHGLLGISSILYTAVDKPAQQYNKQGFKVLLHHIEPGILRSHTGSQARERK